MLDYMSSEPQDYIIYELTAKKNEQCSEQRIYGADSSHNNKVGWAEQVAQIEWRFLVKFNHPVSFALLRLLILVNDSLLQHAA